MESTKLQVFTIAKEYYEKEFTRACLLELARKTGGVLDINKVQFGSVTSRAMEVVVCEVLTSCQYSYEAGTVCEQEYEDAHVSLEDEDHLVNEIVTKTESIIEYTPQHGQVGKKYGYLCYNQDDASLDGDRDVLLKVLTGFKKENVLERGYSTVSNDLLRRFESQSRAYIEQELEFTSELTRNVRTTSHCEIVKKECYRMPRYEVEYMYEGNTYVASGFASGALLVDVEVPLVKESKVPQVKLRFTFPSILSIVAWGACLALVFVARWLNHQNFFFGWLLVLVASVGAGTLHYMQNYKQTKEERKPKKDERLQKLNHDLAQQGYEPCNQEERESLVWTTKCIEPKGNTTSLVTMVLICVLVLGNLIPQSLKAKQYYDDTKFNVYGITEVMKLQDVEGMKSYNFQEMKVVEAIETYLNEKFDGIHAQDVQVQLMRYVDVRSEKSMHVYYACVVKSVDELVMDVINYDWEVTLLAASNDGTLQINYKEPRTYKEFKTKVLSKTLAVREEADKDASKVQTLKKNAIMTIQGYAQDETCQWFKVGENQWVVYNGEDMKMVSQSEE